MQKREVIEEVVLAEEGDGGLADGVHGSAVAEGAFPCEAGCHLDADGMSAVD